MTLDLHLPSLPISRRVLVIHNPTAGRQRLRRLADVLDRLTQLKCHVTLWETTRRGDAEDFAARAMVKDFDIIAAAGGDGTINEIVNGLAGRDGPQLALIPLGTANVLALEIGLDPKDPDQIAQTIAWANARPIHLGMANGRHFVLMAGAGLDARVVEGLNPTLKRHTGKLAYVVEGVKQAVEYDFPPLTIRANGQTYQGHMVVACRGRYYGGPFVAAPDAGLEKASLELCILPQKGMAGAMRYGLALPMNRLSSLPDVLHISADKITITGPRDAPVQGDGDIIARLPAEISLSPHTVPLLIPTP